MEMFVIASKYIHNPTRYSKKYQELIETNTYRKTQLAYHHAEVLQRHDQQEKARGRCKKILAQHSPRPDKKALKKATSKEERRKLYEDLAPSEFEAILNYAQQAMAWSYLSEQDVDSVELGKVWLKSTTKSKNLSFKRYSLKQYIRYMNRLEEKGLVRQAFDELQQLGTSEQQAQARLWRISHEVEWQDFDQAQEQWDALNAQLSVGLAPFSDLNETLRLQDGTELVSEKLRQETQLSSRFKKEAKTEKWVQRMQLKRAQIWMGNHELEPAEQIEPFVNENRLTENEKREKKLLKQAIKSLREEKQREKQRKQQEAKEQELRDAEAGE